MPVIKTIPLALTSNISVLAGATSTFYGIDVADYISAGLSFSLIINAAAVGDIFLKVYGCNDALYSINTKFDIVTIPLSALNSNSHISLRCLEFRNLAIKVVNGTNYSLVFSSTLVGVRLS